MINQKMISYETVSSFFIDFDAGRIYQRDFGTEKGRTVVCFQSNMD